MADWQTVRYDPTYDEPLDVEIIPLLDAMNAAGFVTITSCWGHGRQNPMVWFEHSTDERIERLARFVKSHERSDFSRYSSDWQKEIDHAGYSWSIRIRSHNLNGADTTQAEWETESQFAIDQITNQILAFSNRERAPESAL
jgi:hypothetical protein